jgi:methylated-DNA-[protein]-cysteine S-methyltransferase
VLRNTLLAIMGTMKQRPGIALSVAEVETPIGTALLVTDTEGALRALDFADYRARMQRLLRLHYGSIELHAGRPPPQLRDALARYFDGELTVLADIAWRTAGTEFQRTVWQALTHIAAGTTTTYGALARTLGIPNSARAVGLANGSNPVSIVVPCHRVIGADGTLTGYGGGLHRKQWLLRHEGLEPTWERSQSV